ncbi:hypothetical protein A355_016 [Candidatus Carsonella ruddii HT isolate Thao2000]|uniref:Uncharacterized protein n=1 Tax=Candidatus Carsonella ruddii HT isolate Thao2000 TaxID=1202539 RepID=J3YQ90_CARRU|nr:hypothetical protein [Candidatus Carsonella ruddii]AFP84063.1 hypothetical protein A355_016 [Candidatus Carsonella ruddii HT isolate Thao2000]
MKKKNYILIIKNFLFLNKIFFIINNYKSNNYKKIINKKYYLNYKNKIYFK